MRLPCLLVTAAAIGDIDMKPKALPAISSAIEFRTAAVIESTGAGRMRATDGT